MDVLGDGVERGKVAGVRGGAAGGSPCARRTRTMKQCSSDARTMGHPTHSPFESTATGMGRGEKGKTLVERAPSGPALLPKPPVTRGRERNKEPKSWLSQLPYLLRQMLGISDIRKSR
jgi:hypothetical protein